MKLRTLLCTLIWAVSAMSLGDSALAQTTIVFTANTQGEYSPCPT